MIEEFWIIDLTYYVVCYIMLSWVIKHLWQALQAQLVTTQKLPRSSCSFSSGLTNPNPDAR